MEFEVYAIGLCAASVCTSLPLEDAADRLNRERPTGIQSQWELSPEKFKTGHDNGMDCPDHKGNKHYLFRC